MGSGKSAVGRRLARALGWRFLDMDREIERAEGRSVEEIFAARGEPYFRALETRTARRLLGEERAVVASGGGWPCVPGRLEALGPETLSVWLRVTPRAAVERVGQSRAVRPLLEGDDPLARASQLLEEREVFYRKARWSVDTEGRSPQEVAAHLRSRLRAFEEGGPSEPERRAPPDEEGGARGPSSNREPRPTS